MTLSPRSSYLPAALLALVPAFAVALPPPAAAQGPSFDCGRASTVVERAICGSGALSALDRQLAGAYAARRGALGPSARERLRAEQRSWLGQRDRCGGDADCLANAMRGRIAILSADAQPAPAAGAGTATGVGHLMGRWQPYGTEANFFSAMTLSPTRMVYDDGLVFELRQVRPGSNVFRVLAMRGEEPGICGNGGKGSSHVAFTMLDGFLQLHHYDLPSDPPDALPMIPANFGKGLSGNCSVSSYTR